jgi:hypothetical protein
MYRTRTPERNSLALSKQLALKSVLCMLLNTKEGRTRMEPMDLLADTRRSLADAVRQLAAIEAGAPIAKPLTREQAINIVTEQIGLFESVLRRYGGRGNSDRR